MRVLWTMLRSACNNKNIIYARSNGWCVLEPFSSVISHRPNVLWTSLLSLTTFNTFPMGISKISLLGEQRPRVTFHYINPSFLPSFPPTQPSICPTVKFPSFVFSFQLFLRSLSASTLPSGTACSWTFLLRLQKSFRSNILQKLNAWSTLLKEGQPFYYIRVGLPYVAYGDVVKKDPCQANKYQFK